MTSDDRDLSDEPTGDGAGEGSLEPPIWIPRDDEVDDEVVEAAEPASTGRQDSAEASIPLEPRTGLPMSVLVGGALVVLLAAAVVFGIIATRGPATTPGSGKAPAGAPAFTSSASASASASAEPTRAAVLPTVTCRYPRTQEGSVPRRVGLPKTSGVVKSGRAAVELDTNQGKVALTLDRARTPCTVNNFLELAANGFFTNTPCHRITTRGLYVLQCGDPGGTGTGGPGYTFADENLPRDRRGAVTYPAGTVAMANAGPDTNGSQFFIVYADTQLMPTWTVFGQVTSGLEVLDGVAAAGSTPDGDGKPKRPITVMSVMSVPPAR